MAWTPPSHPNFIVLLGGYDYATKFIAEILPGFEKWSRFYLFFVAGGGTFELRHSGNRACGIPEEDTIVITGGIYNNYVTRWVGFEKPDRTYNLANMRGYHHHHCTCCCRYNVDGFVKELPQLPENRYGHACAALPSTKVKISQPMY